MGTQIRRAALVILIGFLTLSAGVTYWQVARGAQLESGPGNPRVAELSARENRGTIFSADGVALARSEVGPDGRRRRIYSAPSLAQTTGYVSIKYGLGGLEEAFNDELSGARGSNAADQFWRELSREPARGNDLVLTINAKVQQAAATALGDRPGAVVALDPRSGAVLALASSPSFDAGAFDQNGASLLTGPGGALINRVTQGQYAPGSVFKSVTAVAALDSGEYQPSSRFKCPSAFLVQGFVIACTGVPAGVTDYDFAHAYAWSINANFAEVGLKVGAERLVPAARRFGFEDRIPFDLPVTPSHLTKPGDSLSDVLLATTSFGQGDLSVTPLQMALVAAAIANSGVIMQPFLVADVRSPAGESLRPTHPRVWRTAMRPEIAATLRSFMVTAVREGASASAAVPGVQVGGKTGTAENAPGELAHSWFTGIAPAEQPSVVVAVVVENAGPGSTVAGPIAGAVMAAALGK